jgi:hypothetical protein
MPAFALEFLQTAGRSSQKKAYRHKKQRVTIPIRGVKGNTTCGMAWDVHHLEIQAEGRGGLPSCIGWKGAGMRSVAGPYTVAPIA